MRPYSAWRLLLAALLALLGAAAGASVAQSVEPSLWAHAELVVVPEGSLSPRQVASLPAERWTPAPANGEVKAPAGQSVWLRVRASAWSADPKAGRSAPPHLLVRYANLDLLAVHHEAAGEWLRSAAGDSIPVQSWPRPALFPVVQLNGAAMQEGARPVLVELRNALGLNVHIEWMHENLLAQELETTSMRFGIYFGVMLASALVALLGSYLLPSPALPWYFAYAAGVGLTFASLIGAAGVYLWPHAPSWNDGAGPIFILLASGCLLQVLRRSANLNARMPLLDRWLWACALGCCAAAAATWALDGALRAQVTIGVCGLAGMSCLVAVARLLYSRDASSVWVALSLSPIALALPVRAAAGLNLSSQDWGSRFVLELAMLLHLPLLLLYIGLRAQSARDHQRLVKRLDVTDERTGLKSEAALRIELDESLARARRNQHVSALVLLEVPEMRQLSERFGDGPVQAAWLRYCSRLRKTVREVDVVASLDDGRLAVLIEGPVPDAIWRELGAKFLALGMAPFKNLPLALQLKPRAAVVRVPKDARSAHNAISLALGLLRHPAAASRYVVYPPGDMDLRAKVEIDAAIALAAKDFEHLLD